MLKHINTRLTYKKLLRCFVASLSFVALPAVISAGEFTILHSGSQYGEVLPCG